MASFPKSSISLCLYVCVCLWVPVHICACVCWHAEARGGHQMPFSVALLPHFLRQGLLLKKLKLTFRPFGLTSLAESPRSSCLVPTSTHLPFPSAHGCWGSKLCPHAGMSWTEPSLQRAYLLVFCWCCFVWKQDLTYSGESQTSYVAKDGHELLILLLLSSQGWDFRGSPLCSVYVVKGFIMHANLGKCSTNSVTSQFQLSLVFCYWPSGLFPAMLPGCAFWDLLL